MKTPILLGILGALVTGVAIGTQSTLSTRIGSMIGNFRTGLLMNFAGGIIAGVFVLALTFIQGKSFWNLPASAVVMLLIAGALGILIITGVAFSLQLTGVAAGLATVILGEMVVSVIVDAKGLAGATAIPITWERVVGLLVIVLGVYLILPKK
ncbi:MAG: DMT family transporter [Anaerolineaceae bacterium]|jgi:transporter family-2 protein